MSKLFLDVLEFHADFSILFDRHVEIREEVLSNWDQIQVKDFTSQQEESIRVYGKGFPVNASSLMNAADSNLKSRGWHLAAITQDGHVDPYNFKILPKLCSLMLSFGNKVTVSAINFLSPNASLDWHTDEGYSARDGLRSMWVLDAPEEEGKFSAFHMRGKNGYPLESRVIKNNELYSFKHSTCHKVENNLSNFRTVLIFDTVS